MTDEDAFDFAIVVYREDECWDAEMLPVALTSDLQGLIKALRQQPSESGTIGLVAVGDEFFVALRVLGERVDVFLSDIAASWDFPLAQQVLEYLDVPIPDEDEMEEILQDEDVALPAGDLSIFADLGLDEMELGILSGDMDLLPEDVLSSIAARLGFSEPFERAIESVFG
ncbi:tRNA adenosine deaminase-associated protein [Nonomuraea rhodomycinica]|uniref:tRNA adenosine deaminase-associated protein n=1 Tax=Nonomuraea rhodomycinica TaxID=1712872 RepID=A0A7Y6MF48_9ACTN|nr:tRNA adenosine deaminase-associated protein [Nonomuraea rhodomycinica]NUW44615.1 tRNA adenosine deaminase-associated protein [Nonomuraea rhodomycinica]